MNLRGDSYQRFKNVDKMVENDFKRNVAVKVRINEINNGVYIKGDGEWDPNYLQTLDERKISRANVIGVVVSKEEDENFTSVILDDKTGQINARVFKDDICKLSLINIGDVVLIVGRPREYGSNKYLLIEIIKKVDSKWIEVRNLELGGVSNSEEIINDPVEDLSEEKIKEVMAAKVEVPVKSEPVQEKTVPDQIIDFIRQEDSGEGVDFEEVVKKFNDENAIKNLLGEGELFEVKPGRLKVLE